MKIKTILKISDVLEKDGYKPKLSAISFNKSKFGYLRLTYGRRNCTEKIYSKVYTFRYILKELDSRPFETKTYD